MKRTLLLVVAAIAGISLFLLTSASANTPLFDRQYPLLLALNGAVAVALGGLLWLHLRGLWREYRAAQFGSRLKLRLMLMFALMALLPGLVMYAVSLQFVVRSIESWFDVRVDSALEGGVALGQSALDYLSEQTATKAREIALELAEDDPILTTRLNRLREQAGVQDATVINQSGQVVASTSVVVGRLLPMLPSLADLRQARQSSRHQSIDGDGSLGVMTIRVVVPIPARRLRSELNFLQVTQPVPEAIVRNAEAVQAAYREYQQLSLGRVGLQRIYLVTLSLALLLALLAAMAIAFLLARRLVAPLLILAEGTQAVAQGDFRPRAALPDSDELGVLTQSFNAMTRQLDDARALAERNRAAVEAARAYLESVLANLSAGVLAFAPDGSLRAANRGAVAILDDDLEGYEDFTLAEWPRHHALRDAIVAGFAEHTGDWHRQIELVRADGLPQTLLLHGTRLPGGAGTGWVVVFDDISSLIAAQRTEAWAEVARRLAHEIKNPLTPIQLSAERLAHKLADRLDADGRAMLERATQTIVNQVEAMKNLVNAFRDYAKLPAPVLAPLDLDALVREVLSLYESSSVRIVTHLAAGLPPVLGDASQLRQVIHNLLQNAEDALAGHEDGQVEIVTRVEDERVALILRDNGPGFPAQLLARAFEPYFTTKSRGTGLGLAIVKKIIDEHGGSIRLSNRETGGAEVRIHLRAVQ